MASTILPPGVDRTLETDALLLPSASAYDGEAAPSPPCVKEQQYRYSQSPLRTAIIISCGLIALFLSAVDHTILATLAGPIATSIGSLSILPYLSAAYILLIPPAVMLAGRVSDVFGRGPVLAVAAATFGLANVACGLAPDPATFLAGRVLAGAAGGPMLVMGAFLNSDLVPMRSRGVVNGLLSAAWGIGCILGGFLGGVVFEAWGWRMAFLAQAPICLLVALVSWVAIDLPPTIAPRQRRSALAEIDFTGAGLTVLFVLLLTVPLNAGGTLVGWSHPAIWVSLALAVATVVALVWWEATHAHNPIIPVHLFTNRTILLSFGTGFIVMMLYLLALFYFPLYLQVMGQSARSSGLWLMLLSAGSITGGVACGYVVKRTGRYLAIGLTGIVAHDIGLVILLVRCMWGGAGDAVTAAGPDAAVCLGIALLGFGSSAVMNVVLLACLAALESGGGGGGQDGHRDHAAVIATLQFFREIGSVMGIAAPAAVFQNILRAGLRARFGDRPGAARDIEDVLGAVLGGGEGGGEHGLPSGWDRDGVLAAFGDAFVAVWGLAVGLSLVATVMMALVKQYRLKMTLRDEDGESSQDS